MNRHVRIFFSALLIVSVVSFVSLSILLFRDFIPSERPMWEKWSLGVGVLANLMLVAAFVYMLRTRRLEQRFFFPALALLAIRLLIEAIFS